MSSAAAIDPGAGDVVGRPRSVPRGTLRADFQVRRGNFALDVAITAAPGEIVAVLGPNGAGKSTLLAVLAGLLAPSGGSVTLGGRVLTDDGHVVPAEARRVGLMGQDPRLFPHLSAQDNIAFGPRSQGASRRAAARSATRWLADLGLAEFAHRRPDDLSGGQRQRVALARAMAAEPELLLLDEPLAALDARTAPEIRQLLRTHLRRSATTTVLVTHDVLDAATLADRVVVLAAGHVVDSGPTAQVLAAPRSDFSAALAGLNLMTGTAAGAVSAGDAAIVDFAVGHVSGIAATALASGDDVTVVFPPAAVSVYLAPTAIGSPRNAWWATVVGLEPGTAAIRVRCRLDGGETVFVSADVTPAAVAELDLAPDSRVYLTVKATEVRIHRR